jgi:hypothetical protein
MMELLAAMVVLGVFLGAVAQIAIVSAAQHAEMERRTLAVSEAQRVVEEISALPFADVSREALAEIELRPEVAKALADAELAIDVADEAGPPRGKRVRVEITWQSQPEVAARPVRLTTWRFAAGGAP